MIRHPSRTAAYRIKQNLFDRHANCPHTEFSCRIQVSADYMPLNTNRLLRIQRDEVNLNGTNIHDPLSGISLAIGEILHHLELEITDRGEITRIRNLKALQKKWTENIRFRLENTYSGETARQLLSLMDRQIGEERLFILSLQRDPFLFFYIHAVNSKATRLTIPWIAECPVVFGSMLRHREMEQEIELLLTLPEDQSNLLQEYYAAMYGSGTAVVDTDIKYIHDDRHYLNRLQAGFDVKWNGELIKSFRMEAELIK